MKGKLIVIEGTDCSGKETQANLIIKELRENNIQVERFSFPNYQSPTGKIVGGSYLGKEHIGPCLFPEGAVKVDPKVAALYYAADRKYNIHKIVWLLEHGIHVILDRYIYSNMAHQGCKIEDEKERKDMYMWLEKLEFELLELPVPDIAIFLHMPTSQTEKLKKYRIEKPDLHELDTEYLYKAERSYIELAEKYSFKQIDCTKNEEIRTIEDIHEEVMDYIKLYL